MAQGALLVGSPLHFANNRHSLPDSYEWGYLRKEKDHSGLGNRRGIGGVRCPIFSDNTQDIFSRARTSRHRVEKDGLAFHHLSQARS